MTTKTITVNIEEEVLRKLRLLAEKEKYKKGFLGKAITQAVKNYLEEQEQEDARDRLLARLKKGYNWGKIKIKHRDELYDRK